MIVNGIPDELQNSVEFMLQIEDFLADVEDGMDEIPEKFKEENAINTLKELAEHGRCSIPEYYLPDEQIEHDGKLWWSCTCTIRSWAIQKTGLATSKKEAKRYSAYLVLCDFYGFPDEYNVVEDEE